MQTRMGIERMMGIGLTTSATADSVTKAVESLLILLAACWIAWPLIDAVFPPRTDIEKEVPAAPAIPAPGPNNTVKTPPTARGTRFSFRIIRTFLIGFQISLTASSIRKPTTKAIMLPMIGANEPRL